MKLLQQIDLDLKQAMLARDESRVSTLRSIKSSLTYASVDEKAKGASGELTDEQILVVVAKESKKRQDSAEAFTSGGAAARAEKELAEKKIIDSYLPEQLADDDLEKIVDQVISETNAEGAQAMGAVIGRVKVLTSGKADGARIAKLVRERLSS